MSEAPYSPSDVFKSMDDVLAFFVICAAGLRNTPPGNVRLHRHNKPTDEIYKQFPADCDCGKQGIIIHRYAWHSPEYGMFMGTCPECGVIHYAFDRIASVSSVDNDALDQTMEDGGEPQ